MHTRTRSYVSLQANALKVSCLTAFLFSSSSLAAQDCQTVDFISASRGNHVEVGSTLKKTNDNLLGIWSDYLSASRMHPHHG